MYAKDFDLERRHEIVKKKAEKKQKTVTNIVRHHK